jgi:predicted peptidase
MKLKFLFILLPFLGFSQLQENKLTEKFSKEISVNYVIHLPLNYKNTKEKLPLIVFLHGAGERGNDLSKMSIHGPLKYINEGNELDAIILAPQCASKEIWDNDVLITLIDKIKIKYKVDQSRIYLTGLSMGGLGTWNLAMEYPELFAAIAPICGPIFFNFPEKVSVLKDKPIWVFHGEKDTVVPISHSERMVKAIESSGGNPRFTIYPEAGHDSWTKTYDNPDFWSWMFSKELQ